MSEVWHTADLHLKHKRINELCGRPFSSVEEGDEEIVRRWNSVVGPQDVVWIHGDLALGRLIDSLALVAGLAGDKRLIPGNHDRVSSLYAGSNSQKANWLAAYRDAGLTIMPEQMHFSVRDPSGALRFFTACHFPYEAEDERDERYADARPHDFGDWLVHGHVHTSWQVRGRQINVGVDVWDFYPVHQSALLAVMDEAAPPVFA